MNYVSFILVFFCSRLYAIGYNMCQNGLAPWILHVALACALNSVVGLLKGLLFIYIKEDLLAVKKKKYETCLKIHSRAHCLVYHCLCCGIL